MSAQQGADSVVSDDDTAAREIIRLEHERSEAYTRRDIAALKRLLPDDFTFTRSVGSFAKRELLSLVESGLLTFESLDRRVEAVKVYLNMAAAFGQDTVRGRYKDQDFGGRYRFSNTYVCKEGRWEVMSTHSSLVEQ